MSQLTIGLSARRTGRTMAMVEALPPDALVITHSRGTGEYIAAMIKDLRGVEFARRARVAVVHCYASAIEVLAGQRRPVELDHQFIARAAPDTVLKACELAAGACLVAGYRPRWFDLVEVTPQGLRIYDEEPSPAVIAACAAALGAPPA